MRRWAFLCADGGVLAWEQGMLSAERPAVAASADQACLRFDHPAMVEELAAMEPLEGKDAFYGSPPGHIACTTIRIQRSRAAVFCAEWTVFS